MAASEVIAIPAESASALSLLPKPAAKLSHDRAIQLLTLAAGLPGVIVCLALLWAGDWSPKVQWTLSALVVCTWLGCVLAVRERVIYPMQTLSNLLNALREGDYSLRSRRARRDDALGEVMREINALGETLVDRRRQANEAVALLQAVITGIDVAVFTFDDAGRLRLVNRAGSGLLGRPEQALVGRHADELGLAPALAGEAHRTFAADFPGKPGARWSLHRTSFREAGRPHQLLVLADVSQSLREEERAAWQRLIRVLGHEINNSLAPIHSIADSLLTLLDRPEPQRAPDWQHDTKEGLSVIMGRSDALNRFMTAYSRLARLPAPDRRRQSLSALLRRAAALETRLPVEVHCEQDVTAEIDGDQIEQALINLIRNATDAALETGGGVRVSCVLEGNSALVTVEDDGMGLSGTANLFVPFFTTKNNGSGIGLVLSRQIVEAHGGTLALEDRAGGHRGCRAALRLPLSL
jgi:two-component system nitrogen regulation sensor histidine kinase NtrY